jgi:hypothetical protein
MMAAFNAFLKTQPLQLSAQRVKGDVLVAVTAQDLQQQLFVFPHR